MTDFAAIDVDELTPFPPSVNVLTEEVEVDHLSKGCAAGEIDFTFAR